MKNVKKLTKQQQFYEKYEYLAYRYANHIYDIHYLGFERQDLIQELKLKIFTSIKNFGIKWGKYKKTGFCKPVPLVKYLESCMNMKLRDYIKEIQKSRTSVVSYRDNMEMIDYGKDVEYTEIDFANKRVIIKGIDILEGLNKNEARVFALHLKGYNKTHIKKIFSNIPIDVSATIENHTLKLYEYKDDLMKQNSEFFVNNEHYAEN